MAVIRMGGRTEITSVVIQGVVLLVLLRGLMVVANPTSCEFARQHFVGKGFAPTDVSSRLQNGGMCGAGSCCDSSMDSKLVSASKQYLDKFLKDSIHKLLAVLETRAKKFDDFFRTMMMSSKREFHEMFKRTYGIIYLQHSSVFTDFFDELERYYNSGRVRLTEVMDTFFVILYQRMFTVINAQYQFDDRYMECVAEHMVELRPFGDVPHKLGVQLRRSFVATRAFYKALAMASDVIRSMESLNVANKCELELARLEHCDECRDTSGPGACSSYCISVMKACLAHHISLDNHWNNFIDALDKVADRLLGPFNIEVVVEPINIKISEAVMIFQENGAEVSNRVFAGCGNPAAGRKKREEEPQEKPEAIAQARLSARRIKSEGDEIAFESLNFNSERKRKNRKKVSSAPTLEKLIKDIKQKVKDSRQFWSQLPYQFCNNERIASGPSADGQCWNGTALGSFDPSSSTSVPAEPSSPVLNRQIYVLQALVGKLQAAYQGEDVDLADDSEDSPNLSGSGSGMDEDKIEGSGDDDDDDDEEEVSSSSEVGVPRAETHPPQPPAPASTTTTQRPPGSVAPEPSPDDAPSLNRALLNYVLPIVLVWFGGAFSDLLL